uniref:von Willebrand factor A domain-containing protein 5A n=1 Tax=Fusarium oxysporum (strain Fo5176) TaxID=660025 RepID=A0A0D2XU47_FUSOF
MTSRHVFTQRLKSGVLFSAPGNMLAMPEGGWGDDTPMNRSRKPKKKVKNRGLDQFSHWVAKVTPFDEPYDDIGSFTPDKDTRNSEYRPYSIPPYPEPPVRPEVTLCLPMLSVSLTATVDGTVAHTELVQKFHNPSDEMIDAAKHVFPLYDGAVITSFECTIGDERHVRGVVKPKAQARKEFEEAVRDRVAAPALLEEHTPEIFETSLGNIPANTTVEINITYIQELKVVMMETEATEGIALTIPMSIAPRYSKSPIEWEPASRVPEEKLDIWIKVMDNGKVNHEGCDEESGYLLQFEGSKPVEYSNMLEKDASTRTYYVWHHESEPPVLRKDFVFVIQMNEDHQIKSGAIACAADDKGLAAMRVNIRPNDLFRSAIIPQSFTGEILFLLDQSGSMGWSNGSPGYGRRRTGGRKIDVMREAMLLALSGIPSTCIFNIISWGSATVGLWGTSQPHTEDNIREAKRYVSQIEATMGGTDLLRALEAVVKRRVQERESTQIIILTDGELEPEDSIQFIWKKRQLFGDKVRFFALGIGDEVSHRLVESIAECGGGYSDVVHTTQTPRWHDRLNRLLKSALEPNSWSCDIDLGSGFERKNLVDYNLAHDNPADGSNIPYIQAPFPISSLHPFSFASITFLVDLRHGGAIPKTVTINTTTLGAKRKTYELPIEISSGSNGTIHRLVAKSVLLDLQDEMKRGTSETNVGKANAENIGTTYSITSKWTSFVAVSENQPTQTVEEQKMNHYKALFDEIDIEELLNAADDDESTTSAPMPLHYAPPPAPVMSSRHFTHAQDSPSHELMDDAPADTAKPAGVEAYAQAVARKRASKSSYPLPFRPMGNRRPRLPKDYAYDGNSDDDTAQDSPPRNAAQSASSPRTPSRDQDGQVFEPVYFKPNPAFYSPSPLTFHEKVPLPNPIVASKGLTKSIHRVMKSAEGEVADEPTVQPRADRGFFERGSSVSGNAGPWCSDHDSDHDERSQSSVGSPSPPPTVYGPLDWQFAMECQDETAKKFGPKISELLHNSTTPEQERDDISARVLDTLMMIECYKTHRSQEEDTWDLMMERAWDAVISVLGLSDEEEELEELVGRGHVVCTQTVMY